MPQFKVTVDRESTGPSDARPTTTRSKRTVLAEHRNHAANLVAREIANEYADLSPRVNTAATGSASVSFMEGNTERFCHIVAEPI